MTGAPLPADEARRLLDLARYQILDSAPEADFDRITRLAARVLRVPVAVLNLVDQHRQWGKASYGLTCSNAPRETSFCAWTILDDVPFVVDDAQNDPRFRENPMVVGSPHIHMYAGAPLITPAGHRIGTLCVTDSQPHPLSPDDLQALQDLATVAMQLLELRRQALEAQQAAEAQEQQAQELRRTLDQARVLEGVSSLLELDLDPQQATLSAAALIGEALEADLAALLGWPVSGPPDQPPTVVTAYRRPSLPDPTPAVAALIHEGFGSGGGGWTRQRLAAPLYLHRSGPRPLAFSPETQVAWVPLGEEGGTRRLLLMVRLGGHWIERWRMGDRTLLEAAGRTIRHAWQRRAALELAQRQARQDALTGLLNRRAFDEDLADRKRRGQAFTLALVDLDGLKTVNDCEGHAQGDTLLQVFGAALEVGAGAGGAAYRLGGDEFALLLPRHGAQEVVERVERAAGAARGVTLQCTGASTGVAQSHEAPDSPTLLRLADERMYAVKRRRQRTRQPIPG